MKRSKLTFAVAVILSGSILMSSCVGSFATFNRLSTWNRSVSNKFVNELVFLALTIIPVYGVAYLADILVVNSIEFWKGENPVANAGDVKKIRGEHGNYTVETLVNGYTITKEGETQSVDLIYNAETQTWSMASEEATHELIQLNDDGTADLCLPDGTRVNVVLNESGLAEAHQFAMAGLMFAAR